MDSGGAVCLLLMILLIRRAKLQHLVWRLPPSPPSPHSPPASSAGTSADTGAGAGGTAARVLSGVELRRFVKLALPSACVMWIEWWSFEGFSLIAGTLATLAPSP